jgi:hypothetical protein
LIIQIIVDAITDFRRRTLKLGGTAFPQSKNASFLTGILSDIRRTTTAGICQIVDFDLNAAGIQILLKTLRHDDSTAGGAVKVDDSRGLYDKAPTPLPKTMAGRYWQKAGLNTM